MLDIVAPHQNEAAVAVDGGCIHDRQTRLAVASAGHEGAEGHAADQLDDDQNNDQQDERGERPDDCGGKCWTCQTINPIGHRVPQYFRHTATRH